MDPQGLALHYYKNGQPRDDIVGQTAFLDRYTLCVYVPHFLGSTPFYRISCFLGIPRLHNAFYRKRKFLEGAEHIYIHVGDTWKMCVHSI